MEDRGKACELLQRLEKVLEAGVGEIPAAEEGLFHVRRAMELVRCSPKHQVVDEEALFRRGIIVE